MAKTRADVEKIVKQVLQKFIGSSRELGANDKPISGLGLTSLDGVDFACELQKELGCSIPEKMNPFVKEADAGERNVSQIIDAVSTLCAATQGATP